MEQLISMYIDNELSFDEKILFIEKTGDTAFRTSALELLHQEHILRTYFRDSAPVEDHFTPPGSTHRRHRIGLALAACLIAAIASLAGIRAIYLKHGDPPVTQTGIAVTTAVPHRFVISCRDTDRVEVAGSFTNWARVPLVPSGAGEYWEITLPLSPGEHRYTFIVNGTTLLPDPTVAAREADDFGAVNSILKVEA